MPLGSKFPHVPVASTCWESLGMWVNAVETVPIPSGLRVARHLPPQPWGGGKHLPAFLFFFPHFWVGCSAMDVPSAGASRGAAAPLALSVMPWL